LGTRPGNMSQNDPKTTSLMTSVTKNLFPPTKKGDFDGPGDEKTKGVIGEAKQYKGGENAKPFINH